METCSVFVSLKLHQIERGDPQTTAALWPSKFIKAVGDMPSDGVVSPIPVYLATPSPNGQWMAICSVMPECVLIPSVVSAVHGIATERIGLWPPEEG